MTTASFSSDRACVRWSRRRLEFNLGVPATAWEARRLGWRKSAFCFSDLALPAFTGTFTWPRATPRDSHTVTHRAMLRSTCVAARFTLSSSCASEEADISPHGFLQFCPHYPGAAFQMSAPKQGCARGAPVSYEAPDILPSVRATSRFRCRDALQSRRASCRREHLALEVYKSRSSPVTASLRPQDVRQGQ